MSYYGDILDKGDKRMDYDAEEPFKQDELKTVSFKAKSAPAKGLTLKQACDFVKGKEPNTFDIKHKTEMKQICAQEQYETTLISSSKDFSVNFGINPTDLNKDGKDASLNFEMKCTPQKNEWEATTIASVGGIEMGPVTSYTSLEYLCNSSKTHELNWT